MLFVSYKLYPLIVSPERWIEFRDFGCVVIRDCKAEEGASGQKKFEFIRNPACRMMLAVFPGALQALNEACKGNKEEFKEAFPISVSFFEKKKQTNQTVVIVVSESSSGDRLCTAEFDFEGSGISKLFRSLFAQILKEFNPNFSNSFAFKFDTRFFIVEVYKGNEATELENYSNEKPFLSCYIYPYPKIELSPTSNDQKKMYAFSTLIEATLLVLNSGEVEFKILPRADDYPSTAEMPKLSEPNSLNALADLVCQTCSFCRELGVPTPKKCKVCNTCAKYI